MIGQHLAEFDLAGWQSVLDRNAELFCEMKLGSRIGLLSKDDFEPPNATMLAGKLPRMAYGQDMSRFQVSTK